MNFLTPYVVTQLSIVFLNVLCSHLVFSIEHQFLQWMFSKVLTILVPISLLLLVLGYTKLNTVRINSHQYGFLFIRFDLICCNDQ